MNSPLHTHFPIRYSIVIILLLIHNLHAGAQQEEINLETVSERLFQLQEKAIDYEDIYESLVLHYVHPLNLNQVTPEELASLYILSPAQIASFFEYRNQFGMLLSSYELQAIPNWDLPTIRMMLPFVTVESSAMDNRPLIQRMLQEENSYIIMRLSQRLESQKGYTRAIPDTTILQQVQDASDTILQYPTRYIGSQTKYYGRFRVSHRNDFSFGFTFEKDAGESGLDYYSGHYLIEKQFGLSKLIVGDFQLQIGQGLLFGAGFNTGKGAETVNTIKRNTLGILPYTAALESGFFRGIGLTKKMRSLELTLFYSSLKQDAIIQSDSSRLGSRFASSIQRSGLHRTPSELSAKHSIAERSVGTMMRYRPDFRLELGVAALISQWNTPLYPLASDYNQFEFRGSANYVGSFFWNYVWQNISLFGEWGQSQSGGTGAVGGWMASLSKYVSMSMVVRSYARDFHSFYGNAFSENTRLINETGTYWGLAITPSKKHRINAYFDQFTFPWLKYRTKSPSFGHEWMARYTYAPGNNVTSYIQISQQHKQVTITIENLGKLVNQIRRRYLFTTDYEVSPGIKLRTRIQGSRQTKGGIPSMGFAMIQDIKFQFKKWDFYGRMALFETDDFDNAQYSFENDLLYVFSIPAYAGEGIRTVVMVRCQATNRLAFWIKYGNYTYRNRTSVGSGLEESTGPISRELKAMVKIAL